MANTEQYYSENAQTYFDSTVNADVRPLYQHFLSLLPHQGTIVDAGCGSGRDSKAFIELGYNVIAFDACETLAELASQYLGQRVLVDTFDTFSTDNHSVDGIWACASLLHVPDTHLPTTFKHLASFLKSKGYFYCSFKYGNKQEIRDGRYFSDLTEQSLKKMLTQSDMDIMHTWISQDVRADNQTQKWLNAILVKVE